MKNRKIWRVALPVCIALWVAFIWSRSLMSAEASTEDSSRVAQWLMGLFGWETQPEWLTYVIRKTAHLAEFAVLGVLWGGWEQTCARRLWPWGLAVGAIDECLQFFAPGRAPMVTDVVIDTVGFLCGVAIVWIFARLRHKKKK